MCLERQLAELSGKVYIVVVDAGDIAVNGEDTGGRELVGSVILDWLAEIAGRAEGAPVHGVRHGSCHAKTEQTRYHGKSCKQAGKRTNKETKQTNKMNLNN